MLINSEYAPPTHANDICRPHYLIRCSFFYAFLSYVGFVTFNDFDRIIWISKEIFRFPSNLTELRVWIVTDIISTLDLDRYIAVNLNKIKIALPTTLRDHNLRMFSLFLRSWSLLNELLFLDTNTQTLLYMWMKNTRNSVTYF